MPAVPKQYWPKLPKYLRSAKGRRCDCCDIEDGTVVAAHVKVGWHAGMSRKSPDWCVCFLCFDCHGNQELHPGFEWWHINVFRKMLKERYEAWENG